MGEEESGDRHIDHEPQPIVQGTGHQSRHEVRHEHDTHSIRRDGGHNRTSGPTTTRLLTDLPSSPRRRLSHRPGEPVIQTGLPRVVNRLARGRTRATSGWCPARHILAPALPEDPGYV